MPIDLRNRDNENNLYGRSNSSIGYMDGFLEEDQLYRMFIDHGSEPIRHFPTRGFGARCGTQPPPL